MALIILKIIITSSVLIGFYHFFLAREGSFKFNRFFLILSLLFAYTTPFIAFDLPQFQTTNATLIFGETMADFRPAATSGNRSFSFENLLLIIYALITLALLIKSLKSFLKIRFLQGKKIIYKDQKLTILAANVQPFSFFGIIYLSRKDFNGGEIDERIYLHEKCHVQEYHSLDLLFVELISIFSWFNPALIFYKNAMLSNHEFLADDYVLKNNFDVQKYQYLILSKMEFSSGLHLTHPFNFNNTKKRFIMMTTKTSKLFWLKKIAVLPLAGVLFIVFTKEVKAQKSPENISAVLKISSDMPIVPEQHAASFPPTETVQPTQKTVDSSVKKDTIRENNAESAPIPPPPPPPSEGEKTLPLFPGGTNEFRKLVAGTFDTSVLKDTKGILKTTIYIDIDDKGNMGTIRVEGDNVAFNQEAQRTLKAVSKDKVWIPATENGEPVQSVFKMPLTMQFE